MENFNNIENEVRSTLILNSNNTQKLNRAFILLIGVLVGFICNSQIVVTQNANTQALAQLLAGTGVSISNYTKTCAANGTGTFTNTSSNLGVSGGIILSSGNVSSVPNTATSFASTQFTGTGDAQLSTLTSGTIYDKCVLEFDIVPQGPILKFDYVFASEEYPEWVCSPYNDVFGFFISGPNPGGGNFNNKNLALIPNTTFPVAINTVNQGAPGANAGGGTCNGTNQSLSYSSYYRNNLSPVNPNIVYDGMTTVLSAITPVTPCQTYHLKIAIADVADRIYDSGVFLEAYSITSNPISVSATSALQYAGYSSAYEGCVGGTFTLTLNQPQLTDVYANIVVSGSATNGADYTNIPTTVLFPAGTTSVNINLNAIADGIVESAENVTVAVLDPCTGSVSSSASITIQDDIPPTINVADSTLCLGQSTQLTANGGNSYNWSPATGLSSATVKSPIATPTATTTYTVSMDWGSCIKTATATVYVSNPTASTTANPTGVVCNGGSVVISGVTTGGVAPYSYNWSNGNNGPAITVSSGGTYNVTSTDSYGCSASASRIVTISNLSVSGVSSNVRCIGGNDGAVDVTVTGSNAPFSYNWGGGIVSQDRTNLSAGTYTVTVSNTVGCSVTASYIITQPSTALTTSATNNSISCFGGNNGGINLTVNGGVSPYTFLWSNSATTEDLNNLMAGNYTVTVTDFNGCTAMRSVLVSQPAPILVTNTQTNPLCNGLSTGGIDLTVTGGVGVFSYAWSNGASTQDLSGISAGTFGVTVADGNGCTSAQSINITQPTQISISGLVTQVNCFAAGNGSINLTVNGGNGSYTYNWGGGITTANRTGLAAGNYQVTVTDLSGCSASSTYTVTQPAAPLAVSSTVVNAICNGSSTGSINLNVLGGSAGYTFNWGGGISSQNRTALAAGSYTVTVTDSQSCSSTLTSIVTQPSLLSTTSATTNVSCNGGTNGSINLTTTGGTVGYNYNWGGGITAEDRSNLAAGTYSVTITDAAGCSITLTNSITQPTSVNVSQSLTHVSCNGGSNGGINITVTGGTTPYNYNWGGGVTSEDRTSIASGNYTVTVSDNSGCTATSTATINQPASIVISETVSNASCALGNDGSITLSISGGASPYTFNWGGGITSQNRTGLIAGTYTVTVSDNIGCTVAKSISVSQIGTGISLSSTVNHVSCFGGANGAIDVTVVGGTAPITYNWGGGVSTQDRSALSSGLYTVTVTDGLGCSAVSANNISQPLAISLSSSITHVLCNGQSTGSIDVSASGGTGILTYNWGGGITSQDRSSIAAGSYTLTVTDANLCSATLSNSVTQPSAPINLTYTVNAVSCFGASSGSVNVTATGGVGGFQFLWNNGSINEDLNNLVAGNYSITVTDVNNCTASAAISVNQPAASLSVSLSGNNLLCNAVSTGSIATTATGGTGAYSYDWGGGITTANRNTLSAGSYTINVTDANSCSASASVQLTQPSALSVSSVKTDVTCSGLSNGAIDITVSGGTGSYSYNWGGGITTQDRTGLTAGNYNVTVTDANSCSTLHSVSLLQPSALTLTLNSGTSVCLNPTGTATAVTNGTGTAPYNYSWNASLSNSQTINGLAPGTVAVTVTDANGCSTTDSVHVGLANNNTNASFTNTGSLCAPNANVVFTHTGSSNIISHVWNFGDGSPVSSQNNPSYTYSLPGTYTVTHIVIRGFCQDTVDQQIVINQRPVLSAVVTNVTCYGLNNGSIDLTAAGTAPFVYNWGSGITTQDRTNLAPANYSVTATDGNSCSASLSASVTQPTALTLTYTSSHVTCNGGSNGTINITAAGGTSGYTFNWGSGIITEDRTNLTAGNYNVTVTDGNSCTISSAIAVFQPNVISVSAIVNHPTCNGFTNGSIVSSVSGGTGGYNYLWGSGASTAGLNAIGSGVYNLTVTDANSCSQSASFTLSQPALLSVTLTPTNALCFGGNNGNIVSITSGGTSPFSFIWNDGNTNGNRSALSAGTYSVSVTDNNGCSISTSATVNQPASAVSLVVNNVNAVACFGYTTGSINITASGGTSNYTYNWSDGSSAEDRTGLIGGTYFVSASDQNGCMSTASAVVNQPSAALVIDTLIVSEILCFGASSGSINTTISGGALPYSYLWNNGFSGQNPSGLAAGNYSVTVSDNNGCSASSSAAITQPASLLSIALSSTTPSCAGSTNGGIDVSVSGGVSPYSYNWNNGATTEDLTALTAGAYSVTVTDFNSCTSSASGTLSQPATLQVSSTKVNVLCNGNSTGSISLVPTGGTSAYNFIWTNGATTQNLINLSAGNYGVTVSDANNCTATHMVNITEPAALQTNSLATNVSCNGGNNGNIQLTVSGGVTPYSHLWNNGFNGQNPSGLAAGNYSVTVSDNNGCSASSSSAITQPASPIGVVLSSTNLTCSGSLNGEIDASASGGVSPYSYIWNNGAATEDLSALSAGSYSVTVTDFNSCSASASVTLTQPAILQVSSTKVNVLCNGDSTGSITLLPTGGTTAYNFVWTNGATTQNLNNLSAGSYSVTVSDANNCSTTHNANITEPAALQASGITANVACFGGNNGNIQLSVSGGILPYIFNWSANVNAQNILNLQAGNYSVTVFDSNNCSTSLGLSIVQPDSISVQSVVTNVLCNGGNTGSIDLSATGGTGTLTYNWAGGLTTQDRSGLLAGIYPVTITDGNSCSVSSSYNISQPSVLQVNLTSTNTTCNGGTNGSVTASAVGGNSGYQYNWSNGSSSSLNNNLTAGNYQLTVSDAAGCTVSSSAIVNQPSPIVITESHSDVTCNGGFTGAIDITITGTFGSPTFIWSNGDNNEDISGIAAGSYSVTVSDVNSCSSVAGINVLQPSPFSIYVWSGNVTCNGGQDGSVNLTVSGASSPYTFQWTNGATTEDLINLSAGSYNVIIRDLNNCVTSAVVNITQPSGLSVSNVLNNVTCFGVANGSIDVSIQGGTFPFSYSWSDGALTQDRNGLSAGTYQLTVNDQNACAISQPIVITEPALLQISFVQTNATCFGAANGSVQTTVTGGTSPYSYLWSNGNNSSTLNNISAGIYYLTITDASSCVVSASISISQPSQVSINASITDVSCYAGNNGSATITASGGISPYQFVWSNGNTTSVSSGLQAGTYGVTVSDANNCLLSSAVVVNQPMQLTASAIATNPQCYGQNSGAISLTVSGGVSPMSYLWNGGGTAEDPAGLPAGVYNVMVTDANGCTVTSGATVVAPAQLILNSLRSEPLCYGDANGSISVTATGGTPSYSYLWSQGAVSSSITNIASGSYSVTVSDANGCQASLQSLILSQPQILSAGVSVNDVSCSGGNNGAINLTTAGGTSPYQYLWSNGASLEDLQNAVTGNYTVSITDANGCSMTAAGFINTVPPMTVSAIVSQPVCVQDFGAVDLTVSGGVAPYNYNWSNGSTAEDLSDAYQGSYSLVVTDNNGCVFDSSFVIESQNSFSVTANGSTTLTLGETANLDAVSTGGNLTNYYWTPTFGMPCPTCQSVTVQPGQTTIYTVVATDTNGCVAQDTVVVEVIADHTVFTPNAFSPNGDGNNDVFQLFGNKAGIKYISIMIFNRWGEKIFEGDNPDFSWDGTYRGETVEPDVYVYVMKIVHLDGKNQKVFKGSLTVLR